MCPTKVEIWCRNVDFNKNIRKQAESSTEIVVERVIVGISMESTTKEAVHVMERISSLRWNWQDTLRE